MLYQLLVRFNDDTAEVPTSNRYYEFLEKFGTAGLGNSDGTSTVFISSKRELTKEGLAKLLGEDIPIISLEKTEKQDKV